MALQSTFHGPLAYPLEGHKYPIFTRVRVPTPEEVEAGLVSRHERSFYRNSFSMVSTVTILQRCGADTWLITVSPVHGSDFISSPILFPRNQTGNHDTALVAARRACSRCNCTYLACPGDVEACQTAGNLAGERCCRRAISGWRVERCTVRDRSKIDGH